ncbi:uncharacterized protein LOC135136013 [Zophobas morio]|uniref:uncharacterized protein LOC135136013 n=1 Tax=Zophobas morio TaxID=2755281 RepID=UPI003082F3E4
MCRLDFKLILLVSLISSCACTVTVVRDLIQFNIAGHPVLHKESAWNFDPEVGARRSRQYQELNGKFGEKAIERLGLGIDGYDQERLAQQRTRDQGHLDGATE